MSKQITPDFNIDFKALGTKQTMKSILQSLVIKCLSHNSGKLFWDNQMTKMWPMELELNTEVA